MGDLIKCVESRSNLMFTVSDRLEWNRSIWYDSDRSELVDQSKFCNLHEYTYYPPKVVWSKVYLASIPLVQIKYDQSITELHMINL